MNTAHISSSARRAFDQAVVSTQIHQGHIQDDHRECAVLALTLWSMESITKPLGERHPSDIQRRDCASETRSKILRYGANWNDLDGNDLGRLRVAINYMLKSGEARNLAVPLSRIKETLGLIYYVTSSAK